VEDPLFATRWKDIADHTIHDHEVRLLTKDNDKKYCLFSASVEVDDNHPYIQGRLHDMTARKQSEKERLFSEKMAVTGGWCVCSPTRCVTRSRT
jgi:hypothetical protein